MEKNTKKTKYQYTGDRVLNFVDPEGNKRKVGNNGYFVPKYCPGGPHIVPVFEEIEEEITEVPKELESEIVKPIVVIPLTDIEIEDLGLTNIKYQDFRKLIKACGDRATLELYKRFELTVDEEPRKTILDDIEQRLEDIG